jgi:hypothetical protein
MQHPVARAEAFPVAPALAPTLTWRRQAVLEIGVHAKAVCPLLGERHSAAPGALGTLGSGALPACTLSAEGAPLPGT